MATNVFQPVTPDPKKLRRTAYILVVIMLIGGFVILQAYEKMSKKGARDNRPNFVTQISKTKDLTFMQQDGKVTDLMSLKGKVLIIQGLPQNQPDEFITAQMRKVAQTFANNENVILITLMIGPGEAEQLPQQLKQLSLQLGAELPKWIVASNQAETLHKFMKNEFKASMLPHLENGAWKYDRSIVLVDKNRHVRRAVIPQKRGGASFVTPFDFEQAQKWDLEGIKTGTERSNVQEMEALLQNTIHTLLKEKITP